MCWSILTQLRIPQLGSEGLAVWNICRLIGNLINLVYWALERHRLSPSVATFSLPLGGPPNSDHYLSDLLLSPFNIASWCIMYGLTLWAVFIFPNDFRLPEEIILVHMHNPAELPYRSVIMFVCHCLDWLKRFAVERWKIHQVITLLTSVWQPFIGIRSSNLSCPSHYAPMEYQMWLLYR